MMTRRRMLTTTALPLVLVACNGLNVPDLKTAAKEVAHDVIVGAAQDVATIGEAFVKQVLPTLAQQAGPAAAEIAKGLLAEVGRSALEMAKTKATDAAQSLMTRASNALGDVVQMVRSKVAVPVAVDGVIQAAMSLLPSAKTALGMLVPPMAGAMPPDQARAVLRRAAA